MRGEALYTLDKMTGSRIGTERQTTRPTCNYTSTGYIWIQIYSWQCKLNQTNLRTILEFSNASSCTLKIHFLSLTHTHIHSSTPREHNEHLSILQHGPENPNMQTHRHTQSDPFPPQPAIPEAMGASSYISFLISFSPLYFSKQSHMHHSEEHTDQVTHCVRTCTHIL